MRIQICPRQDVLSRIEVWRPDAVISIMDPKSRDEMDGLLSGSQVPVVAFAFLDLAPPIISSDMPHPKHVAELCDRIGTLRRDGRTKFLFHCHAGLSRSPAMAIAALAFEHSRILGRDVDEAAAEAIVKEVLSAEELSMPNRKILSDIEIVLPEWTGILDRTVQRVILEEQGRGIVLFPSDEMPDY